MNTRRLLTVLVLLSLALAACSAPVQPGGQALQADATTPAAPTPAGEATATPPSEPALEPTLPVEPTAPEAAATLPPTVQPDVDPGDLLCVPPAGDALALPETTFETAPEDILGFLNAGGSPAALDAGLYAAGIASVPTAVAAADFNADRKPDVAVSIFDPAVEAVPPPGTLLLYFCQAGSYELAYQSPPQIGEGAPGIRAAQDLNADGAAELVVSVPVCGAPELCSEFLQVWTWTADGFADRMVDEGDGYILPNITIEDPQGTGQYQIRVEYADANGDPQTRVFAWDPASGTWRTHNNNA